MGSTRHKAQNRTQVNNPTKVTCFSHRHMTFAEYGLYTHLREVSYNKSNPKEHTYKFDDRTLAVRFAHERGCSKDTVNRLRQSLARKGFIEWLEPNKRVGGKYEARRGRILSHGEWAARNPGRCIHNVIEGMVSPVSNAGSHLSQVANHLSHSEAHQSQIESSPVSKKASHLSRQRDISLYNNSIPATPSLTPCPSGEISTRVESPDHIDASINSATGDDSPVSGTRQVNAPLGLRCVDGEWFTETGVKVHPDALAILMRTEATV